MTTRTWTAVAVIGLAMILGVCLVAQAKDKNVKIADLPEAVTAAVKKACPDGTITEAEIEKEHGTTIYEIELKVGKNEAEVEVTADGTIIEIETELTMADLPKAVADAITKAANGGKVKEIEKEEERAEVKNGKVVELKTPKVVYEAEIKQNGKEIEIEVDADGKVLGKEVEDDDDDDDGDDDDDDDD